MIPNQGLNLDGNELEQPEGSYRDARNIVYDKTKGVLGKEFGFKKLESSIGSDNEVVIGLIELEDSVVYFLNDSVTDEDEIGIVESNGEYRPLLKVSNGGLGFDVNFPIKGKWIKNIYNQKIIIWTDNLNRLRYLNVDKTIDQDEINLEPEQAKRLVEVIAPEFDNPVCGNPVIVSGGGLKSGGYIPIFRYENSNGVTTNWQIIQSPVYVSATVSDLDSVLGTPDINSGKRIKLFFQNLDQTYKYIELGAVCSVGETISVKAFERKEVTTGSVQLNLDDYDNAEDQDLNEYLNGKNNYETINDLEIIRDELMISNLNSRFEVNYQKYACDIRIDYRVNHVEIKDIRDINDNSHRLQYFMPKEVYAFYIQLEYLDGSYSRAFHIPGRDAVGTEKNQFNITGGINASDIGNETGYSASDIKNFHVIDTADAVGASTNMSFWENKDEKYPNSDDFNSNGGRDLRNQTVKHHRFPSLRHIKSQYYNADLDYGHNKMPVISIDVSNVIMPAELEPLIKGYRILYAKRTVKNQTVLGQAMLQPHVVLRELYQKQENEDLYCAPGLHVKRRGDSLSKDLVINKKGMRFHAFDILNNRPSISPVFCQHELKYTNYGFPNTEEDKGSLLDDVNNKIAGTYKKNLNNVGKVRTFECWVDRLRGKTGTASQNALDVINAIQRPVDKDAYSIIKKHDYIPANSIVGNIDNRAGEEHLHLEFSEDLDEFYNDDFDPENDVAFYNDSFGNKTQKVLTFLSTLCQIPLNVYNKFYEQLDLVVAESINYTTKYQYFGTASLIFDGVTDNSIQAVKGGDSRPYAYFHVTTGRRSAPEVGGDAEWDVSAVNNGESYVGVGWLNARYYLCYSSGNIDRRYQEVANQNSLIYPTFERIVSSIFEKYDFTQGYQLFYSRDYSLRNEYNGALPYNPFELLNIKSPQKLHRSNAINRTIENIVFEFSETGGDTYEMPKDRGAIISLTNINDRLVIGMELSSYITTPRQKIQLDSGEATLGQNELFDIRPDELMTSDDGYVGNNSKFNSILTPYGLLIVDEIAGKIFLLVPSGIEEISKYGMYNYINKNLPIVNKYVSVYSRNSVTYSQYVDFKHENEFSSLAYDLPITDSNYNNGKVYNRISEGDYLYDSTLDVTYEISKIVSGSDNTLKVLVFSGSITASTPVSGTSNIEILKKLDSPFNNQGIITAYDKQNERILITKRENEGLTDNQKENFIGFRPTTALSDNTIFLKGTDLYESISNVDTLLATTDRSFTLSYYPERKRWISFHDYIPKFYVNQRDRLMSILTKDLFIHNVRQRTGYFYNENTNDVEVLLKLIHNENSNLSKIYISLIWNTILQNNSTEVEISDETFELLTLENSYQSTGEVTLVNYVDVDNPNNIRRVKGIWRFNKLRTTGASISDRKQLTDRYLTVTLKETSDRLLFIYNIDLEYNPIDNFNRNVGK